MYSVPGLRLLGPELVAVDPAPVDPDTLVDLINTKVGKKTYFFTVKKHLLS